MAVDICKTIIPNDQPRKLFLQTGLRKCVLSTEDSGGGWGLSAGHCVGPNLISEGLGLLCFGEVEGYG